MFLKNKATVPFISYFEITKILLIWVQINLKIISLNVLETSKISGNWQCFPLRWIFVSEIKLTNDCKNVILEPVMIVHFVKNSYDTEVAEIMFIYHTRWTLSNPNWVLSFHDVIMKTLSALLALCEGNPPVRCGYCKAIWTIQQLVHADNKRNIKEHL